jgi:hypothetical protein
MGEMTKDELIRLFDYFINDFGMFNEWWEKKVGNLR